MSKAKLEALMGGDKILAASLTRAELETVRVYAQCNGLCVATSEVKTIQLIERTETILTPQPKKGFFWHGILHGAVEKRLSKNEELCVSSCSSNSRFFYNGLGIILFGTPIKSFSYDCYSSLDYFGRRYDNGISKSYHRDEHWIHPNNCVIITQLGSIKNIAKMDLKGVSKQVISSYRELKRVIVSYAKKPPLW